MPQVWHWPSVSHHLGLHVCIQQGSRNLTPYVPGVLVGELKLKGNPVSDLAAGPTLTIGEFEAPAPRPVLEPQPWALGDAQDPDRARSIAASRHAGWTRTSILS